MGGFAPLTASEECEVQGLNRTKWRVEELKRNGIRGGGKKEKESNEIIW